MPFQKGQSGNPGGRPKRGWTWADELAKASEALAKEKETPFKELVAKRVVLSAANGNIMAAKELFNRMDGMPKQDIGLQGGMTLEIAEAPKIEYVVPSGEAIDGLGVAIPHIISIPLRYEVAVPVVDANNTTPTDPVPADAPPA